MKEGLSAPTKSCSGVHLGGQRAHGGSCAPVVEDRTGRRAEDTEVESEQIRRDGRDDIGAD